MMLSEEEEAVVVEEEEEKFFAFYAEATSIAIAARVEKTFKGSHLHSKI